MREAYEWKWNRWTRGRTEDAEEGKGLLTAQGRLVQGESKEEGWIGLKLFEKQEARVKQRSKQTRKA
jgi:hypothetical protein